MRLQWSAMVNETLAADRVLNSQLMVVDQLTNQLLALLNVTRTSLVQTVVAQASDNAHTCSCHEVHKLSEHLQGSQSAPCPHTLWMADKPVP